jgi:hypothetical protein
MKRTLFCALAVTAALVAAPQAAVFAQERADIQFASHTELSDLYARLAALESRAATTGGYMGDGGGGCCDDCCRAGFVGGAEVLWLKAYDSNGDFNEFNFDEGFRFWIGYQGDDGLGIRLRYFEYEQTADNGEFIDVEYTDIEVFDSLQLGCNWDLYIGGGLRYLGYEDNDLNLGADLDDSLWGVGPVLSAELYRHIGDRAALYAIGRQSIIVGNGLNDGIATRDMTGSVTEIQLGGQVHREWNGGLLFGRIGWETQGYYDIHDNEELVTLMGLALSVGIMR